MKLRIWFLKLVSLATYIFLWAPVLVIIVFSFSANKYGIKWEGFTWKWYAALFENETVRDACLRSLVIALITVLVATPLGTITAYGLYKLRFKGKELLRTSILLPIVMPGRQPIQYLSPGDRSPADAGYRRCGSPHFSMVVR